MPGIQPVQSGAIAEFARRGRVLRAQLNGQMFTVVFSVTFLMFLVVTAAVFAKKYIAAFKTGSQSQYHSEQGIELRTLPGRNKDPNECLSSLCNWNKNYALSRINPFIRPCEDFYEHVCSKEWHKLGNASARPLGEFTSAELMMDVERFFEYFQRLRGSRNSTVNNFLSQVIWVYGKCKAEPLQKGNVSSDIDQIIDTLGLAGWPFDNYSDGRLEATVGRADRLLRLHPLFRVIVRKSAVDSTELPTVVLAPPETLYRRFMLNVPKATDDTYANTVTKTFQLGTSKSMTFIANGVLVFEKELEESMLPSEEDFVLPPRPTFLPLDIFSYSTWDWLVYFAALTESTDSTVRNVTGFFQINPFFFGKFGDLLGSTWDTVIVNYIGYKAIVELSPFMGATAEYLFPLTHDYSLPDVKKRQEVCMVTLEKLYWHGMGLASRLTLGKEFATTYRTHFDVQLKSLFNLARRVLAHLIDSHYSWFDRLDSGTASRKLNATALSFGTECSLHEYETYRKSSNITLNEGKDVVADILKVYAHASSIFWESWNDNSAAYDNRYAVTTFRAGHEFQETGNLLFIPHATVAFLNHVSNQLHPIMFPMVLVHIVRGCIRALVRSNSFFDDQLAPRNWWSGATSDAYEAIGSCLRHQYAVPPIKDRARPTTELDFLDNAALYPLYKIYKNELKRLHQSDMFVVTYGTEITADKLFFYNLAAAHCEDPGLNNWRQQERFQRTPAKWRVNVPLRNFPVFTKAFGCSPTSKMNPSNKCVVWKKYDDNPAPL